MAGLQNVMEGGNGNDEEDDSGNSKTQIVFWRKAAPKGYSGDGIDNVETAYQLAQGGGFLRNLFNSSGQYKDIHEYVAELLVGTEAVIRDGDFTEIMETVGPNAEALAQYLQDNPEIMEELEEELEGEAQAADD